MRRSTMPGIAACFRRGGHCAAFDEFLQFLGGPGEGHANPRAAQRSARLRLADRAASRTEANFLAPTSICSSCLASFVVLLAPGILRSRRHAGSLMGTPVNVAVSRATAKI